MHKSLSNGARILKQFCSPISTFVHDATVILSACSSLSRTSFAGHGDPRSRKVLFLVVRYEAITDLTHREALFESGERHMQLMTLKEKTFAKVYFIYYC